MHLSNPIESVSAALYAACLRDLPEYHYQDRDWPAYNAFNKGLSKDERSKQYQQERESGVMARPVIEKSRRPEPYDVEVVMFPQMWGSTALGYGGIGGQAITGAYTVIIRNSLDDCAAVYFGGAGRLAYIVRACRTNTAFQEDIAKQRLVSVKNAALKYGTMEVEG